MSHFFDSSWLIGALLQDERNNEVCRVKLDRAIDAGIAVAAQHSLGEVFHTITGKKRVPANQTVELLRHNFAQVRWLALTEADYWFCLESAHALGVRGGAIFDLLLLRTAERNEVTEIYTLNKRQFVALAPGLQNKIRGAEDL